MNNQKCNFILEGNKHCEAKPLKDDKFCFFHSTNPEIVKKRLEASSKGGESGDGTIRPTYNLELKTVNQVLRLLELTINNFLNSRITKSEASCIGYLSNIIIGAIKDNQLEQRLEVIENAIGLSKKSAENSN